ncbi:MAG: GGDEF domain-containing protein [Planctomycetota bacterium]|nr:GGDEF domain-containing protein [Planctomycetota bacterium]
MNSELLSQVLGCKSLPSLPAVAVRVIELTSDKNVRLAELAQTIQHDQGLSAKVLRTVNSSFYGIRTRCSTIDRAIVMLGLSPVKTLALGFSLVSTIAEKADEHFDLVAYWRRGLYSAVAAKVVAEAAKFPRADEAFLAALLQDVGVMAMYLSIKAEYRKVLAETGGDHAKLARAELAAFELQHPEIGAMLCERWRLPDELVVPVRYHERPTAAPVEHATLTHCVAFGNLVHDALSLPDPTPAIRRMYTRGNEWFQLDTSTVDAVLKRAGNSVKEMSNLFKLDTGPFPSVDAVLEVASKRRAESEKTVRVGDDSGLNALLVDSGEHDALTGLVGRIGFDQALRGAMTPRNARASVCLVKVVLEGLREYQSRFGEIAADDALVGVAAVIAHAFHGKQATVCRLGGELFAVVAEGCALSEVSERMESLKREVASQSTVGDFGPLKISVGLASTDTGLTSAEELVRAAVRALQNGRETGRMKIAA